MGAQARGLGGDWALPLTSASFNATKAGEGFPFSRELWLRTDALGQFLKVSSLPGRRGGPTIAPSNAQCTPGGHSPAARQAWPPWSSSAAAEMLGRRAAAPWRL